MTSSKLILSSSDQPFQDQQIELSDSIQLTCQTLTDGARSGVQLVTVSSDRMKVTVCPTRGFGLAQIAIDDRSFQWESPVSGPIHPNHVNLYRPDGLGWLEGFDEAMVRCGLRNVGPPQFDENHQLTDPIHGNIANLPAKEFHAEFDKENKKVILCGIVEDTLFHFHRLELTVRIEIDFQELSIKVLDTVVNQGNRDADVCLMHHWNFGLPVFGEGSMLCSKFSNRKARDEFSEQSIESCNQISAPGSAGSESVFLVEPEKETDEDQILLAAKNEKDGVLISYPTDSFPRWTLWKNPVHKNDGFAIGIEPGTCFPLGKDEIKDAGHSVHLTSGQSFQTWSKVSFASDSEAQVKSWKDSFDR